MLPRRWRTGAAVAAVLLLMTSMSGCGGAGAMLGALRIAHAAAVFDQQGMTSKSVIQVLADISGYTTIRTAIAMVKRISGGEVSTVTLTLNSEGQYEGEYVPDSTSGPANPQDYTVVVKATDAAGNTAQSDPVPVEAPPSTPSGP